MLTADLCGHRNRTLPPLHHFAVAHRLPRPRRAWPLCLPAALAAAARRLMHATCETDSQCPSRPCSRARANPRHARVRHGSRQTAGGAGEPPLARRTSLNPTRRLAKLYLAELNQLSYCSSSDGLRAWDWAWSGKLPCMSGVSLSPQAFRMAPLPRTTRRCWDLRIRHPNSIARIQKLQILFSPILRSSTGYPVQLYSLVSKINIAMVFILVKLFILSVTRFIYKKNQRCHMFIKRGSIYFKY